jgi:hypothetical protein
VYEPDGTSRKDPKIFLTFVLLKRSGFVFYFSPPENEFGNDLF